MLQTLLNLPAIIGHYFLVALISFINVIIFSIGGWIQLLLLLLPSMPAAPTQPATSWLGWLNWLFPIAPLVAGLSLFVVVWTAFVAIRIALRWVKVL